MPSASRLVATAAATAATALAMAPIAHAAPADPSSSSPHGGATQGSDAVRPADDAAPVDTDCAPDYGLQKLRVGVQLKSGAWVPAGSSPAGSTLRIEETGPCSGLLGDDTTWTCVVGQDGRCPDVPAGNGAAWLNGKISSQPLGATPYSGPRPNMLLPGDSATITQISGPADHSTGVDPEPHTVGPCRVTSASGVGVDCGTAGPDQWPVGSLVGLGSTAPAADVRRPAAAADCTPAADGSTLCLTYTPVVAIDPGRPPIAHDDAATTRRGVPVKIPVLGNDETSGAPATLTVTAPGHGAAKISGSKVRYTPAPGFAGVDTFRYTVTTANGASTATVTVRVTAPPASPSTPSAPSIPAAPDGSGDDALSATGFDAAAGGGAGLGAIAVGLVLTAGGRRRRSRRA
jgi:hypothetical protein